MLLGGISRCKQSGEVLRLLLIFLTIVPVLTYFIQGRKEESLQGVNKVDNPELRVKLLVKQKAKKAAKYTPEDGVDSNISGSDSNKVPELDEYPELQKAVGKIKKDFKNGNKDQVVSEYVEAMNELLYEGDTPAEGGVKVAPEDMKGNIEDVNKMLKQVTTRLKPEQIEQLKNLMLKGKQ